MERALRLYNGKAMVNSVNGKEHVMREVFPLVKKYGGVVVALTIDEDGIPATAEGRVAVAEKILARAAEYGISKRDVVVDPLAMTISSDTESANVTLQAIRLLKENLGVCTSLGVSNISFGLPRREIVNAAFFAMALQTGLDCAIMNPDSQDMMQVYYSFNALRGRDANCARYIEYASALPAKTASAVMVPRCFPRLLPKKRAVHLCSRRLSRVCTIRRMRWRKNCSKPASRWRSSTAKSFRHSILWGADLSAKPFSCPSC